MGIKGNQTEAKEQCNRLDKSSTLITIGSLNEQKFIEKLVQSTTLCRTEYGLDLEWNDNTFKWMDGSDNKYQNWDENAVKNGNNNAFKFHRFNRI